MRIAYTAEQEELRRELRNYFTGLMTTERRAALTGELPEPKAPRERGPRRDDRGGGFRDRDRGPRRDDRGPRDRGPRDHGPRD